MLLRKYSVSATRRAATKCRVAVEEATSTAVAPKKYKNVGPLPQRFAVSDGQLLSIATASVPAVARLGTGALCVGYETRIEQDDGGYTLARGMGKKLVETSKVGFFPRPAQPLELYEFEGCPFCKKVREAISMLDLDVLMRPCPKDGDIWRPQAIQLGGKKQFPYLVDPNTGVSMYESDDIIRYLFQKYGDGEVPLAFTLGPLTTISAGVGLAFRAGSGNKVGYSVQPKEPLVFWGYEASPFVKVVREVLCEMQLPYLYRNVARGSPRRQELLDKYGVFQVPCLEDPNTESYLFESAAIVRYLRHQYGVGAETPSDSSSSSSSSSPATTAAASSPAAVAAPDTAAAAGAPGTAPVPGAAAALSPHAADNSGDEPVAALPAPPKPEALLPEETTAHNSSSSTPPKDGSSSTGSGSTGGSA